MILRVLYLTFYLINVIFLFMPRNNDPIELGSHDWEVARNRAELRGFTPEIMLTPANQALKADLIQGMERTLFGPQSRAITVEGTDTEDNFRLDYTRFVARVAFLHLEDASAAGVERPFDLALGTFAMHLDLEKIAAIPEEELKDFDYDSFDGIYLEMLDILLKNHSSRSIHHSDRDSRYGFQYYESVSGPSSGYRYVKGHTGNVFESAYGIARGYQKNRSSSGFGSYLEELKVLVDILKNGQPDQTAMDNLTRESDNGDAITIIPEDSEEATKISPFLYGLFKEAVETPDLRDQIARHQYWHVQTPGYLLR